MRQISGMIGILVKQITPEICILLQPVMFPLTHLISCLAGFLLSFSEELFCMQKGCGSPQPSGDY